MSISRSAGALLLFAIACAAPDERPLTPASRDAASASGRVVPRSVCPSAPADVSVSIEDVPGGIAVDFQSEQRPEEIRRRVHVLSRALNEHNARARARMAEMASRRAIARALPPGVDSSDFFEVSGPGGPNEGMDSEGPDLESEPGEVAETMEVVIPVTTQVRPLLDGGRLLLTPHDANNLDELRSRVRQRAALLRLGECPALA